MTASTTGGSCLTAKGLDISLAALQRQDPYINNIVDVASQVALYTFSSKANEWEKTDVEGTLFVYTRLASPRHGFTIMNRLSMENLTEPITKDLDFQLQDPFLLYRNARLAIHGIWFYDKTDCQRIAELMKNLTRQEQQLHHQQQCGWVSPRALDTADPRGVDILQMLTKARDEYDKGKVSSEPKEISGGGEVIHDNPHLIKPIPLKPSDRHRLLQHQDGDSKPVSLISLFGSQPHAGLVPAPLGSASRAGVGGRPVVARSLSYDDPSAQAVAVSPGGGPLLTVASAPPSSSSSSILTATAAGVRPPQPCAAIQKLMSSQRGASDMQPLVQSPDKPVCENGLKRGGGGGGGEGGDPLQKLFPNTHALQPTLHPAPTPSSSSSSCCPVSHPGPPLMPGLLQPVRPPEAIGGVHHHHHQHQQTHQHQHQHPHPHIHQHPHQQQHQQPHHPHPHHHHHQPPPAPGQPIFYSPKRPLLPNPLHPLQVSSGVLQAAQASTGGMAPPQLSSGLLAVHMSAVGMPAQVSAGMLPTQVSAGVLPAQVSAGVLPAQVSSGVLPAQVSSGVLPTQVSSGVLPAQVGSGAAPRPTQVGSGVVSPHELLQRLQLVQQEQNQTPEPSRPALAPCFRLARPTDASSSASATQACASSSQHFQAPSSSVGSTLLMSPSVFSQSKPSRSSTEPSLAHGHTHPHAQPPLLPPPAPEEPRALSKSQLQATLIHLIQTDASFLEVIYEAYMSRLAKDSGPPHY